MPALIGKIHKTDFATVFTLTLKNAAGTVVDISAATTKNFLFRKPDASVLTKTATFVTDGTDGQLTYTTLSTDIDAIGIWTIQPLASSGASKFYGQKLSFEVLSVLA